MFRNRLFSICMYAILIKFVLPSEAHAYLDPGSGSFILQIILAGIMGFIFMVKIYWKKIRTFFAKATPKDIGKDD